MPTLPSGSVVAATVSVGVGVGAGDDDGVAVGEGVRVAAGRLAAMAFVPL